MGNYILESDVDNWPIALAASETFDTTDVDINTEQITVASDIPTGTELKFSSTGAIPAGLTVGTVYYAIRVDATHIKVALSPVNAAAGTAINLTDVGSGTHTLQIGSGDSTADRAAVIERAEQLIERICEDVFYSKAFIIYRDGNAKNRMNLGLTSSILTVTEIKLSGVVLNSNWWTFDDVHIYKDPEATAGGGGSDLPELHYRMKQRDGGLFPAGKKNVKVTGTMGSSVVPSAIKKATVMLCQHENDGTLFTAYDDVVSDKLGDESYSRGSKRFKTGVHEVDRLIRDFIRRKPMMGVS
jgi:hypothetical protein